MSMHHTDERRAIARVGRELEKRDWKLYGFKEDRSDAMTDYYDPERWDGVATHPDRPGFVACVKVGPYTVERCSGRDGWPEFRATPKGKAWHLEKDGEVIARGVGLSKCASYDKEEAREGIRWICDTIEHKVESVVAKSNGQDDPTPIDTLNGVRVEYDRDWTWVFFPVKPETAITDRLGRNGMGGRFSGRRQGWFFKRHVPMEEFAWLVGEQKDDAEETEAETEPSDPIGPLYRDWLSITNGDESAYPSGDRLAQYAGWGRELLAAGSRETEGVDFRRFCRVRVEGKMRHMDLMSAGNAYRNGVDFPAPTGWEFLAEPESDTPIEVPTIHLEYAVEGGKILFAGPGWQIRTSYTDPDGVEHVNSWYLYRDTPKGLVYAYGSMSLSDLLGRAPETLGVHLVALGFPGDMPDYEPDTYLERKARRETGEVEPNSPTGMDLEPEESDPEWLNEEGKIRAVKWEIPFSESSSIHSTAYSSWEALFRATKATLEARLAEDPELGWYHKTDFRITYADGYVYEGRMDIGDSSYDHDAGVHMLQHNRFYAGQWCPPHLTEEQYRDALEFAYRRGDGDPADHVKFLECYEIVAFTDGKPKVALDFADNGAAVSFSNEEYPYRLAALYVERGQRYSNGWKVHRRGPNGWMMLDSLNPAAGSRDEWKASLTLTAAIERLEQLTGDAILLIGKPDDLPDSYAYVSEESVLAGQRQDATGGDGGNDDAPPSGPDPEGEPKPDEAPAPASEPVLTLPNGWQAEDLRCLLDALDHSDVFVADSALGVPVIHEIRGARHLGMGVFEAETPDYVVRFLAGHAMRRTPNEMGWTGLTVERGSYPYDRNAVRARLEGWLRIAEQAEAEPEPELNAAPEAPIESDVEMFLDEALGPELPEADDDIVCDRGGPVGSLTILYLDDGRVAWTGDVRCFTQYGERQFRAAWEWLEESKTRKTRTLSKSYYGDERYAQTGMSEADSLRYMLTRSCYAEPDIPSQWENPGIHLAKHVRTLLLQAYYDVEDRDGRVFYECLVGQFDELARVDDLLGPINITLSQIWAPERWVESLGREVLKRKSWKYVPTEERRLAKKYRGDTDACLQALADVKSDRQRNAILSELADLGQIPDEYIAAERAGKPVPPALVTQAQVSEVEGPESETIVLSSFDNGKQFGYDNPDHFGIWGPYKDADGKRWTHGWTVWDNTRSDIPIPVADPSYEGEGCKNLGSWSMSEAVQMAADYFGVSIQLDGEQWDDEYPRYGHWVKRVQIGLEPGDVVVAIEDFDIAACNVQSPKGNRCRKDREIKMGDSFEVIRTFVSTGAATHGDPVATVRDAAGYELDVRMPQERFANGDVQHHAGKNTDPEVTVATDENGTSKVRTGDTGTEPELEVEPERPVMVFDHRFIKGLSVYECRLADDVRYRIAQYDDGRFGVHYRADGEWHNLGDKHTITLDEAIELIRTHVGWNIELPETPDNDRSFSDVRVELTYHPDIVVRTAEIVPRRDGGFDYAPKTREGSLVEDREQTRVEAIAQVNIKETPQPETEDDSPYSDEDIAAYEGQWDLYFETGPVSTVRKVVKRIASIGILQVAYERVDRALSESTIEDRRTIIQRRIRQLEKLARAA